MTDFGRRAGVGDMLKSVYDPDLDGVIAVAQTKADMEKADYDPALAAIAALQADHDTQHEDGGTDEIDLTGLSGALRYVDRGDPTGWDKILSDFTTDGDWHDLNLSALVPAGAISIHVQVYVEYGLQGAFFHLRKKGNTYALNRMGQKIQSMGFGQEATGFVSCDVNRTIEYRASAVSFSDISLLVKGWFI